MSSPPGSTVPALTAPLVPTRQGSVTTTPFRKVPDPGPPGGQNAAQRHASARARGCSTGGVWVRGGFPQQRRLGSKLHPSLQVLQHPATAGGQWGVVTPCHTARLTFTPRGPRDEVPTSVFRSHVHANLPSARSPTQGLRGKERGTKACQRAGTWLQHRWSVGPRRLPPAAEAWFEAPSFPTSAAAPCHGRGTVGSGYPMSHRQAHVLPSRAP